MSLQARGTTAISVPPEILLKLERLAKHWRCTTKDALERVIGDETTWQAIVASGRLDTGVAMPPGPLPTALAVCRRGIPACPTMFQWRGVRRCGCPGRQATRSAFPA